MKKAYFCIDGFSFKRISDFYRYEHKKHSRLCLSAIETYLRYEIANWFEWNCGSEELYIEKHFYHPSENPQKAFYRNDVKEAILKFERSLTSSGYNVHYAQKANAQKPEPNKNIFIDWVIASALRKYDIFILLTTQGQYASILKLTKRSNVKSILLGWDSFCKNSAGNDSLWKTDKALIKYANIYCPLERMLSQANYRHSFADIMFEKFYPSYLSNSLPG
jgi:hypothetical protein